MNQTKTLLAELKTMFHSTGQLNVSLEAYQAKLNELLKSTEHLPKETKERILKETREMINKGILFTQKQLESTENAFSENKSRNAANLNYAKFF
ncbi:hypothetical protein ACYRFF_04870 [Listeria welshimeri]|uniref:Uncharacterized protein n=1 Tax=Listeria welshimeri TaxID=1643 RepID=A0ABX4IGI6_LISWE|nr:hypothetical protein [Listeria welshimeri]MBC1251252.1 hypothetical protein [Listeria welshimeri]MBC2334158.1 hypothetical protein [Listeria welshimeri]MBS9348530.1 hypothetical protein [Listeria welshimeri]PDK41971.1 hypothetical protein AFZ32_04350 [Listeria welshimeri]